MGTAGLTIRQYLHILKAHWLSGITITGILTIAILAADVAAPYLAAKAVDALSTYAAGDGTSEAIWTAFWQFLAVSLVGLIAWRIVGFWNVIRQPKMLHLIERRVFDKLTLHSYTFFANRFGGALVTQANRYARSYEQIEDTTFYWTLPMIIRLIASLAVLLVVLPSVGIALTLWAALFITSVIWLTIKVQTLNRQVSDSDSWITARLADVIANILNLKSFGKRQEERRSFRHLSEKRRKLRRATWIRNEWIWTYTHVLGVGINVLVLWLSITAVTDGTIGVGVVLLALLYATRLNGDLSELQNVLKRYSQAFGDAAEMTLIMDAEPSVRDPRRPESPAIKRGAIRFERISFAYRPELPVFRDFDLDIAPGERVGLVGHSGSGKSSLVKLLLRFVDIQGGVISIDGQDIRKVKQDQLRSRIAYVPQEPVLFHRTLAENIRYAKPHASDSAMRRVARLAHAAEFIERLPDGYDTLVGERGVKLSGGERQRIAIARAMLSDSPILILDEATSSLDSESERLISDALRQLMRDRTTIVIAHRLSTIRDLDRIVVLDQGRIVETGTHKQLLSRRGPYRGLWEHQTGGFIGE